MIIGILCFIGGIGLGVAFGYRWGQIHLFLRLDQRAQQERETFVRKWMRSHLA